MNKAIVLKLNTEVQPTGYVFNGVCILMDPTTQFGVNRSFRLLNDLSSGPVELLNYNGKLYSDDSRSTEIAPAESHQDSFGNTVRTYSISLTAGTGSYVGTYTNVIYPEQGSTALIIPDNNGSTYINLIGSSFSSEENTTLDIRSVFGGIAYENVSFAQFTYCKAMDKVDLSYFARFTNLKVVQLSGANWIEGNINNFIPCTKIRYFWFPYANVFGEISDLFDAWKDSGLVIDRTIQCSFSSTQVTLNGEPFGRKNVVFDSEGNWEVVTP